jgi:hypothetical protein
MCLENQYCEKGIPLRALPIKLISIDDVLFHTWSIFTKLRHRNQTDIRDRAIRYY